MDNRGGLPCWWALVGGCLERTENALTHHRWLEFATLIFFEECAASTTYSRGLDSNEFLTNLWIGQFFTPSRFRTKIASDDYFILTLSNTVFQYYTDFRYEIQPSHILLDTYVVLLMRNTTTPKKTNSLKRGSLLFALPEPRANRAS